MNLSEVRQEIFKRKAKDKGKRVSFEKKLKDLEYMMRLIDEKAWKSK